MHARAQNLAVSLRMAKFTGIRATSTASDAGGSSRARRQRITEQVRARAWAEGVPLVLGEQKGVPQVAHAFLGSDDF